MIPLHEAFYDRLLDEGYPRLGVPRQDRIQDPEGFARNLAEVSLDYLFVSRYVTLLVDDAWPPHRAIIREMPEFQLIWTDGYSELYRRTQATNPMVEAPSS